MEIDHLSQAFGQLQTDVKWIRQKLEEADKKFAPMWVKYPVYAGTGAILFWTLNQILALIPRVQAFL